MLHRREVSYQDMHRCGLLPGASAWAEETGPKDTWGSPWDPPIFWDDARTKSVSSPGQRQSSAMCWWLNLTKWRTRAPFYAALPLQLIQGCLHEAYGAAHTMEKSCCTAAMQQQASLDVLHFELQLLGQTGFCHILVFLCLCTISQVAVPWNNLSYSLKLSGGGGGGGQKSPLRR